ncbi:MFS transporter [Gorillibacterium sp. sgz5001074]|uniref:MFS transporter n=1 Tax=Gorillibacterium sp. sgz5001074 TaxID=3446695 RepID=UPI003F6779F4
MPAPATVERKQALAPGQSGRMAVFAAVTILYWIGLYTYVPVLSPYLEDRGYSYSVIGIVLGSYGLVQILVRLPLGIWSDRLGVRKPFIIAGMAAATVSCLLFLLPGSWAWSLAARAMAGVAASTWVGFTVLFASYYPKEEATRAMGTISFLTVIGQLAGMAVSGLLAERFGWNATFVAGALAGAAGMLASWAIQEPPGDPGRAPMQAKDLASVVRSPMLLKVSVLSILAHGILFITMFGFTPSQAIQLGADKAGLTLLSVCFMVPHAVTAILSGKRFAPRYGPWNTAMAGFAVSACCTALIPFVPSFALLCVTQAVNGFAQGLHMPLLLGLAIQEIEPAKRATAMGFYQAVYALGMFSGPFVAGWLNESYGLAGGFWLGAAIGLFATLLTAVWKHSRP